MRECRVHVRVMAGEGLKASYLEHGCQDDTALGIQILIPNPI